MGDETRWGLRLQREGAADARSLRFDVRVAAAAALGVALLLLALGAGAGVLVERSRESERVAELRSSVQQLRERQGRVVALAARLDSVEEAYTRLRRTLVPADGLDRGPARLPTPPAGDVPPAATAGAGGELPAGWPLARPGFVTRRFRPDVPSGGHRGIDVAVPTGSYVRAAASGVVREVGRDSIYGRFVRLGHPGRYVTLYGHAAHVFVRPGDSVGRGQVIGLSGNSGRSTAPHLHVEVHRGGDPVDPLRFFRGAS